MSGPGRPKGGGGPVKETILRTLKEAGGWISKQEIQDACYSGCGANAPQDEENVIRSLICHLRKRVRIERSTCYRIISD